MKKFLNEENDKLNIRDYIVLFIIILIYSVISFINLGDFKAPNSFISLESGNFITIKLDRDYYIARVLIYNGENNSKYQIYTSNDDNYFEYAGEVEGNGSFSWNEEKIMKRGKYIKLIMLDPSDIGEVGLFDNSGNKIKIDKVIYNYSETKLLTDEEDTIPKRVSYMNSTYFDEIYFARCAYDYVYGLPTYEWTHPPLGKLIQAIPIYLTHNMSPFNYRLMGNISGILIIGVMYLYGHMLFKKRKYSIMSSLLMAFDTFHFAHTRMGTVDSHLVLFMLLSSYFMIKYFKDNKVSLLFLSGLFFGLSVCVKWTGFYMGLSLCILYISYLIIKKKFNYKSILYGFSFFIVIPLIIYCSLYLMFPNNSINYTNNIESIIKEQKDMYEYHSNLDDSHPFSSKWYTWPISYKPVWYHESIVSENYRETITGVGNIVIWWVGIVAFIYLLYKLIRFRDKTSFILVTSILSLWLPYMFIGRVMFLYHFYPVVPFMMMGIVYMFKDIEEKYKINYLSYIYLLLVVIFFIIYYPVVSGIPISNSYIDRLRLFSSWIF